MTPLEGILAEAKSTNDPTELHRLSHDIELILFGVQYAARDSILKSLCADLVSATEPEAIAAAEANLAKFICP